MTARRYLETLRALKIPHIKDGALRLTEPSTFVAALAAANRTEEPIDHAERIRQRLGKRRSA